MADHLDLVPVTRTEFAAELVPCLALTSGVGMSAEDQRVWLNAAFKALDGVPAGLLARGAAAAMRAADHPAKIVPAIMAAIGEDWRWRRAHSTLPATALPTPRAERETVAPEETRAILANVWPNMSQHAVARDPHVPTRVGGGSNRPGRMPTRADYIAMGVDPAVLDGPTRDEVA